MGRTLLCCLAAAPLCATMGDKVMHMGVQRVEDLQCIKVSNRPPNGARSCCAWSIHEITSRREKARENKCFSVSVRRLDKRKILHSVDFMN